MVCFIEAILFAKLDSDGSSRPYLLKGQRVTENFLRMHLWSQLLRHRNLQNPVPKIAGKRLELGGKCGLRLQTPMPRILPSPPG
jgi:hypothetical protein